MSSSCSATETSHKTDSCLVTEKKAEDEAVDMAEDTWIAVEPPMHNVGVGSSGQMHSHRRSPKNDLHEPPSFRDSRFGIILRHQRMRPADNSGLKCTSGNPSRFINLTNSFEFAGWGIMSRIKLTNDDYNEGASRIQALRTEQVLGQFLASGLAGNAVLGSVFYALPAVVAVSGIYSPISLFIATLILFLWRPIMEELASALPISGGPYTLNVSTKTFALVGAALLLLDFASTSVVSAATAATYLKGEVPSLPFPPWVGAIIVLVIFTLVSLAGVRESARITLGVLSFHIASMLILIIASVIHWSETGTGQLKANWALGKATTDTSVSGVAKQIYYGVCLGMLGLTGFECTPSYVSRIKPGKFPLVLRNLHIPAIGLNTVMMLLVLALIPMDAILGGANVLSMLAQASGGSWLRIWVVVDAFIVLCGGVLTGILSACELLQQLALHRVIPKLFLTLISRTGSPYISVLSFIAFSGMIYATSGASLVVISEMFSLVWLCVMSLFPISLLLLKFNRGRLPRQKPTKLIIVVGALLVAPVIFAGNVAFKPQTAGYFAAYFLGIIIFFLATQNKVHLLRWIYWSYDQYPALHAWNVTRAWGEILINTMCKLRRQHVCILVKTDEINNLFHMILYVRKNEETSNLKIVHFYEEEKGIPSELEANAKILDEAFPEITIDLVFVNGQFEPTSLAALSHHLAIPQALMFMTCPSARCPHSIADFGTRIISL